MAGLNNILQKLFGVEADDDLRKKVLDHNNPEKKDRLLNTVQVLNETEEAYRTRLISEADVNTVYNAAREHIGEKIGVTGYLVSSKVDRYEAGKRDRKG